MNNNYDSIFSNLNLFRYDFTSVENGINLLYLSNLEMNLEQFSISLNEKEDDDNINNDFSRLYYIEKNSNENIMELEEANINEENNQNHKNLENTEMSDAHQKNEELHNIFEENKNESNVINPKINSLNISDEVYNEEIIQNNNLNELGINNNNPDILNNNNDEINANITYINGANDRNNVNNNHNHNKNNNNFLGKKRKKNYSNINTIIHKIRIIILNNIILFINNIIRIIYKNDIGYNYILKQFLKMEKESLYHSKVEFDKEFLNKKLKDILSEKISKKYTNYPPEKNKTLVESLIKDSEKGGEFFKKLFELTFLDCLKHINGDQNLEILNGLMKMDEMLKFEKIEKDQLDSYKTYIKEYKNRIMLKTSRKSKSKKVKK